MYSWGYLVEWCVNTSMWVSMIELDTSTSHTFNTAFVIFTWHYPMPDMSLKASLDCHSLRPRSTPLRMNRSCQAGSKWRGPYIYSLLVRALATQHLRPSLLSNIYVGNINTLSIIFVEQFRLTQWWIIGIYQGFHVTSVLIDITGTNNILLHQEIYLVEEGMELQVVWTHIVFWIPVSWSNGCSPRDMNEAFPSLSPPPSPGDDQKFVCPL